MTISAQILEFLDWLVPGVLARRLGDGSGKTGSIKNLSGKCSFAAAEGSLPPPLSLAAMNVSQKIPTSQCVIQ